MSGILLKAAVTAAISLSYMVPLASGSADDTPIAMPDLLLTDGSGTNFPLSRYRGNVLVVQFWSSGFAHCLEELIYLNRLQGDMPGKPMMALAVSEDDSSMAMIKAAMTRQKLNFLKPFGDPGGNAARILNLRGLPTSFLVDRKGFVVMQVEGPQQWDRPDYEKRILLLASQPYP